MYKWMRDPEIRRNLGLRAEPSLERTLVWITNALADPLIHPHVILLEGDHVGNVILDRLDHHLSTARLSVYIGEAMVRGSGVGLTAIYLALSEAFHKLGLYKVWLTVRVDNVAAIKTYSRMGFVHEGILRGEFLYKGERADALYFELLAEEFDQIVIA
jgi:RimJ/RimL family protein N-acetyltransferase